MASRVTWLIEAGGHGGGHREPVLGRQQQEGQQQLLRSDLHKPGWTLKVRVLRGAPHHLE